MRTTFLAVLLVALECVKGLKLPNFNAVGRRQMIKNEILQLARAVDRGLTETAIDKKKMKDLFETLEKLNASKNTLQSSNLNAIWLLEYTTSDSILGRGSDPRVGPIFQKIDAINLTAENSETVRYLNLFNIPRKVTATLRPISGSKVAVQFKRFSVGPFTFNAPESFKGELDVTYLDEDLRLSRGDKGNIFVLTKFCGL